MSDPVETQLTAYNVHDVDAFLACYTDDCIVEDGAGALLMSGKAEMRSRYETLFASSPDLHAEIVSRVRIGEYVIDEEQITGRVPAFRRAVAVYHLRVEDDCKIDRVRFYREA
ncbi:MAG: nuclear transport factor 2 family protein [Pseudomonadota bacterium]